MEEALPRAKGARLGTVERRRDELCSMSVDDLCRLVGRSASRRRRAWPLTEADTVPVLLGLAHRAGWIGRPALGFLVLAENSRHLPDVLRPAATAAADVVHAHVSGAKRKSAISKRVSRVVRGGPGRPACR